MTSEFLRGYKAALRYLIDMADERPSGHGKMRDVGRGRKFGIVGKKTAEWLKLCYEYADRLADGDTFILWMTPEGKLFFKKDK